MKKFLISLGIIITIPVFVAILGCDNIKANAHSNSDDSGPVYEDRDIKVYRIQTGSHTQVTVAYSKKSGFVSACY